MSDDNDSHYDSYTDQENGPIKPKYKKIDPPQEFPNYFSSDTYMLAPEQDDTYIQQGERYDATPAYVKQLPKQELSPTITKTTLYRQFQDAVEANKNWLDSQTQTIHLSADDAPVLPYWTKMKVRLSNTTWFNIKQTFMVFVYFGIYAILAFFFLDRMKFPLNETFQAFFFPVLPYVLFSYKSFERYLKSIVASGFILIVIYRPMMLAGVIDIRGVVFIRYFLFLQNLFPKTYSILGDIYGTNDDFNLVLGITLTIFLIEFVLMILYWIFKKVPRIEMVISKKAIFIRAKTKASFWDILKTMIWIIFNPFNVQQYKTTIDRIKYNKLSKKEGRYYDFARIGIESIKEIKRKKNGIFGGICGGLILTIILGSIFPLLAIFGIVWFVKSIRAKGTYQVIIKINRNKAEGSWILSHTADILDFYQMPPNIANYFPPMRR